MKIGEKIVDQIIIYSDSKEVLAVISDNEIIEMKGVNVTLDEI